MYRQMLRLKKLRPTAREMITPLFLLRCIQLGLAMTGLDLLSISLINDMYAKNRNDECKYATLATQEDFHGFNGVVFCEKE